MLEKTIGSSRAGQYLSDRAKRALGDRKKWTSRELLFLELSKSREKPEILSSYNFKNK
jgi:hypothetical protein